jgi:hypothetical protein
MTVTLNPQLNGSRQRKSLAGQLDRLDSILDGLDGALSGAITDAVKQAVSTAVAETVRATLAELFTSPDLLALIRGNLFPTATPTQDADNPAPANPPRPNAFRRAGGALAKACAWSLKKLTALGKTVASPVQSVCQGAVTSYRQINAVWRLRQPILIALGVGAVAGVVVGVVSAPWLAGVVSGLSAMGAALGAQFALVARRLLIGFSLS